MEATYSFDDGEFVLEAEITPSFDKDGDWFWQINKKGETRLLEYGSQPSQIEAINRVNMAIVEIAVLRTHGHPR